jgi:enterochelin esterase-like enzyme
MKNSVSCLLLSFGLVVVVLMAGGCFRQWRTEPWETEPLARGEIEVVELEGLSNLSLQRVRFYSEVMDSPRFLLSLMPITENPPKEVFILNHGWRDRPEDLLSELEVAKVFADLLVAGKVRPALVVLPDVRFDGFFRRNSGRFPNYLDLVAEEILEVISKQYSIPLSNGKWSVGGFSFGGYLALDIARRYPGRFDSVSVVSGFFDEEWSFWPSSPPVPGKLDDKGRGKHTVVVPGPIPRVLLACGTDDRMFDDMTTLHGVLEARGIEHQWLVGPGNHDWEYWATALEPMMVFHLAAGQVAPDQGF